MRFLIVVMGLLAAGVVEAADAPAPVVRLYAAGSLRAALTEMNAVFRKETGISVQAEFSASGLLRGRIEKGEVADVFASADMGHPETLSRAGLSGPVRLFARNRLCALAQPQLRVSSATLLDVLLDPAVRVGTSTPKNDPSGDYTWTMFEKAERLRSGAYSVLSGKALKLVGAADSPPPPKDRTAYSQLMADNKADIFITYCTNAVLAVREVPGLVMIQIPEALAVGGDYGMTVMASAGADAQRLAQFIMSPAGQAVLQKYGFSPGNP